MQTTITFSQAARDYIKKKIEDVKGKGFRLSIKKTGCSGYAYLPGIVNDVNPTDVLLTLENGIFVYLDRAWLDLLEHLEVDYIEESQTGLKQKRLVFNNPKEAARCGCGESFQIGEG